MDFSNLTVADLKSLSVKVQNEIVSRQQGEVKKARDQILAIAQNVGLPLSDLLDVKINHRLTQMNTDKKKDFCPRNTLKYAKVFYKYFSRSFAYFAGKINHLFKTSKACNLFPSAV